MIVAADSVTMKLSSSSAEYSESTGRCPAESSRSSTSSWRRFAAARNSASRPVHRMSHGETGTAMATAPATARSTNPAAMTSMSTIGDVLERERVEQLQHQRRRRALPGTEARPRTRAKPPQRKSTAEIASAADALMRPLATGRSRFTGCWRSLSASRTSLSA